MVTVPLAYRRHFYRHERRQRPLDKQYDVMAKAQHAFQREEVRRIKKGNSPDKLCHPRSNAYSAQQVLLNKQQIWCGGAYLDCYLKK